MELINFYNLINSELSDILSSNKNDSQTLKHKDEKLNKGYALLIWFLKFYGQKDIYKSYITEGKDDSSCDIIFMNKDSVGNEIFYIIQSKHINSTKSNEEQFPKIDKEEFGAVLNDFSILLNGEITKSTNENFTKKQEELKKHLAKNGKVKFIFFTLAKYTNEINDSIQSFNKAYSPAISLEIIDLEKIRRDYIEFKFKEITTSNPLEYTYTPEDRSIKLTIEQFEHSNRNILEFEGRAKAYLVVLKPKTIHDLFLKYKYNLFFKNVRNPLDKSNYNEKIVETLLTNPESFWYYNNDITAISKILPSIGIHAKFISIDGLQIINGAQTVFSVYSAYQQATYTQRKVMDAKAKISFRLIESSDTFFDLQITRYTNMQNPMQNSDFYANDDVQKRLQNESFKTRTWYEKRRGEFQLNEVKKNQLGITIVSNLDFAIPYTLFHLENIHFALYRQDDFFMSWKEHKNGLYEYIFNQQTEFEDMYVSYRIYLLLKQNIIEKHQFNSTELNDETDKVVFLVLFLSKNYLKSYFERKFKIENQKFNLEFYLIELFKSTSGEKLLELSTILKNTDEMTDFVSENNIKYLDFFKEIRKNPRYYEAFFPKLIKSYQL